MESGALTQLEHSSPKKQINNGIFNDLKMLSY
jgi:hypothetical protein